MSPKKDIRQYWENLLQGRTGPIQLLGIPGGSAANHRSPKQISDKLKSSRPRAFARDHKCDLDIVLYVFGGAFLSKYCGCDYEKWF